MNPPARRPDPRLVLLAAVPVLVGIALTVRALVRPGPDAGWRTNVAIRLSVEGRHELALARFQDLLADYPDDVEPWLRGGRELRVLGRPSEAAVFFRHAAELDPRKVTIRFELARALLEAGLPELAELSADSTLALDPDHAGAYWVKAAVAARGGDALTAAELLARSLDLKPDRPDRYRSEASFDPVRNDPAFLDAVVPRRVPGVFAD